MQSHATYMRYALRLARRGLGRCWPNPSVGCVLVKNGQIIGVGVSGIPGQPHAEVEALRMAGEYAARGATAYVTLEPCSHTGKTPPCADALIKAGIACCVFATADPNPLVSGKGLAKLRKAGIEVITGICEAEAREQHAGFFRRITHGLPLVAMKIATSLDGRMALPDGRSQWITGEAARAHGHSLRAQYDAILTGSGTLRADNPRLTCRLPGMEQRSPLRVLMSSSLELDATAHFFNDAAQSWVITGAEPQNDAIEKAADKILRIASPDGRIPLLPALKALGEQGVTRLLIEAGPTLSTAFLREGLVDKLYWYRSATLLGGASQPAIGAMDIDAIKALPQRAPAQLQRIGEDWLETLELASCLPASSPISAAC